MATVTFDLKRYLTDQAAINERSAAKKDIPSQIELAQLVGRHEVTFSRILSNKSDTINLEMLGAIMVELRQRGFDVDFNDLFSLHE